MKIPSLYQFTHTSSLIFFGLYLLSAPAYARGGPGGIGFALLIFGAIQLIFYALIFSFSFRALWLWYRKKKIAIWSIAIVALPLLHYVVQVVSAQFEPSRREAQLASIRQSAVVAPTPPRSIQTTLLADKAVQALVAVGVVDEIQSFNPYANETTIYKLHEGSDCIDFETSGGVQAEYRRVVLARHAFRRCAKEIQRDGQANAQVELFTDRKARNRYKGSACLSGGNYPLELRWTSPQGRLFAFWESPSFGAFAFPPMLFGDEKIWQCSWNHFDMPNNHYPDTFQFISNSLGFKQIDDFPKSANSDNVAKALQLLVPKMGSQYAYDHVLALMGQWPTTPAIDNALLDYQLAQKSDHLIQQTTHLLLKLNKDEAKKRLYPHILTHIPTLLKMCPPDASTAQAEMNSIPDSCTKLIDAGMLNGYKL
jgi:hypothetical protein